MIKFDGVKFPGSIAEAIFVATLPIGVIAIGLIGIIGVKSSAESQYSKCVSVVVLAGSTPQAAREACTP